MSLSIEELSGLEDEIMERFPNEITGILSRLNISGQLEEFLNLLGMDDLTKPKKEFYSYVNGKIVVVGETEVKEEVLLGIAKNLGIEKDRFVFCLDYKKIQKYKFKKMQYAPQYRIVLFGPTPHSGYGKGDSRSIISGIENENGYPRVERLMSGMELKITKTNFREKLQQLIDEEYI